MVFDHDSTFHGLAIAASPLRGDPHRRCVQVSNRKMVRYLASDLRPSWLSKFPFSSPPISAKSAPFPFFKWRCLDGQKIKTSGLDTRRCAHVKNGRQEEDTGGKHCPNVEAYRGCYPSEGIQPRLVSGFASLRADQLAKKLKPRPFARP